MLSTRGLRFALLPMTAPRFLVVDGNLHRVKLFFRGMTTFHQLMDDVFVDACRTFTRHGVFAVELIDERLDEIIRLHGVARAGRRKAPKAVASACFRHGLERKGPTAAVTFLASRRIRP